MSKRKNNKDKYPMFDYDAYQAKVQSLEAFPVYLIGTINEHMIKQFAEQMQKIGEVIVAMAKQQHEASQFHCKHENKTMFMFDAKKEPRRELHLFVNSLGGGVDIGMMLYRMLVRDIAPRWDLVTHCYPQATSAAIYPFMAGSKRVIYPESTMLFHSHSYSTDKSMTISDFIEFEGSFKKTWELKKRFYMSITDIPEKILDKWNLEGNTFLGYRDYKELFKYGIATHMTSMKFERQELLYK